MALTVAIANWIIRSHRRQSSKDRSLFEQQKCTKCGYDIRENPRKCPECGDDLVRQVADYYSTQLDRPVI
jgi:predicted Zn-ribbon and HTH transcriptional regulator